MRITSYSLFSLKLTASAKNLHSLQLLHVAHLAGVSVPIASAEIKSGGRNIAVAAAALVGGAHLHSLHAQLAAVVPANIQPVPNGELHRATDFFRDLSAGNTLQLSIPISSSTRPVRPSTSSHVTPGKSTNIELSLRVCRRSVAISSTPYANTVWTPPSASTSGT